MARWVIPNSFLIAKVIIRNALRKLLLSPPKRE